MYSKGKGAMMGTSQIYVLIVGSVWLGGWIGTWPLFSYFIWDCPEGKWSVLRSLCQGFCVSFCWPVASGAMAWAFIMQFGEERKSKIKVP